MNTLSYHNDPAVKAFHVAQAKHHLAADMLVSGTYGEGKGKAFRGCSIGCMAHDINPKADGNLHAIVAEHAGWPEWLARLNDSIFEGLPPGERETFHVRLREAIPVGANLEPVRHHLALRRIDRLIALQTGNVAKHGESIDTAIAQVLCALQQVRRCHEAEIGGSVCDLPAARSAAWSAAQSAQSAAWSAAQSAAESAAQSAQSAARSAESAAQSAQSAESAAWSAWSAAQSAAWSARSAAQSARSAESAWSARSAAARSARSAQSAAWKQEATDLLQLLAESTP